MKQISILWADDEIDLLKPHILFLEGKSYQVITVNNGDDAVEQVRERDFDIIFLDENMPGTSGLQALSQIKNLKPGIPVVMITKSEEENIMDEAIGSKISDYLIKPVNPNQILLTIKKNIDHKRLVTEKTTTAYQSEFSQIGMAINDSLDFNDWVEVYKKLVFWELELESSSEKTMDEVLRMQKNDANASFCRFIKKNYSNWFDRSIEDRPMLSMDIFKYKVAPHLSQGEKVFFILIDNLRYDQWRILQSELSGNFQIQEDLFFSILPTATQYSRNSMFAGLMPYEINKIYPDFWLHDEEEGGKNLMEKELLMEQLKRLGLSSKLHYEKVNTQRDGNRVLDKLSNILENDLSVVVYNFVDMLSHARTEMQMIRELASDEAAYRSLTLSWFRHSPLLELLNELATKDIRVVLTTDHGTIRVNNPLKVIGDRNTTTNLRYKQGKNLNYNPKEVMELRKPEEAHLPKSHVSSSYIFACGEDFFAYPNNFNYYAKYYKNTFQHGGISMEEMIIPVIDMHKK